MPLQEKLVMINYLYTIHLKAYQIYVYSTNNYFEEYITKRNNNLLL